MIQNIRKILQLPATGTNVQQTLDGKIIDLTFVFTRTGCNTNSMVGGGKGVCVWGGGGA